MSFGGIYLGGGSGGEMIDDSFGKRRSCWGWLLELMIVKPAQENGKWWANFDFD